MPRTKAATVDSETVGRLLIVRGVVAVLFGILALIWPGLTVVTLGILLTIWLLVSGVTGIITSLMHRHEQHWIFSLILAFVQLGIGAYLIQRPSLTVATMVALVAIVLVVEGVVDIVIAAMEGQLSAARRWMGAIVGVLAIVAGILVWRYPVQGTLAFVWVLGLYALVMGSFTIAAGIGLDD